MLKIIEDPVNLKDFMEYSIKLLKFKEIVDTVIEYSFGSNIKFERESKKALTSTINKQKLSPKYLAAYSDKYLIDGIKGLSNQDIQKGLQGVVRLFCCLNDRDVFMREIQDHLHLRLLNKTVSSKEAEEKFI